MRTLVIVPSPTKGRVYFAAWSKDKFLTMGEGTLSFINPYEYTTIIIPRLQTPRLDWFRRPLEKASDLVNLCSVGVRIYHTIKSEELKTLGRLRNHSAAPNIGLLVTTGEYAIENMLILSVGHAPYVALLATRSKSLKELLCPAS